MPEKTYNVYERRSGSILHYIGCVKAESEEEAEEVAAQEYGGQITVKEQLIP